MSSMTLAMLLTLKDLASGPLGNFTDKLTQTSARLMATGAAAKQAGEQILKGIGKLAAPFMDAEDAAIRLKNEMKNASGVAEGFEKVNVLANELGKDLPGNTADFQNLFATLKQNGMDANQILGGTGKAAAYLAVQLKMPFEEAGLFAAKVGTAAGIASKDMMSFMDVIQKTASMGVKAGEMQYAFSKAGSVMNSMGLGGLKNAENMAVVFAQLIRGGMSGEALGTNFGNVLMGMQKYTLGIGENAKSAKDSLKKLGVDMQFFKQENGKSIAKGPREIIAELGKLNKLTETQKVSAIQNIFGSGEDYKIALDMLRMGVAGYDKAQREMKDKATLTEKVEEQLKSLTNVWDAAQGTFTNLLAGLGATIAPELKTLSNTFAELSDSMLKWTEQHPELAKLAVGFAAVSGASLVVGGTTLMSAGMVLSASKEVVKGYGLIRDNSRKAIQKGKDFAGAIPKVNNALKTKAGNLNNAVKANAQWVRSNLLSVQGIKDLARGGFGNIKTGFVNMTASVKAKTQAAKAWVRTNLMTKSGLKGLAQAPFKLVSGGFRAMDGAIRAAGLAALSNPLLWIAIAIAGAGLLIYKYWKPIKGFFSGLWQGLKSGLAPLAPAFKSAFKPWMPLIRPIIGMLKGVWNWIKNLLKPVDDVGNKSQNMGKRFGQAIAGMILKGAELVVNFTNKVAAFVTVGKHIVEGFKKGFNEAWAGVSAWISEKAGQLTSTFKSVLGINSPSRVFMGFGKGLGQGLQMGMDSTTAKLNSSARKMAKAAIPEMPKLVSIKTSGSALPAIATASASLGPGGQGAGKGGSIQITFAPNISLSPGSPAAQQVQEVMPLLYDEFKRMIRQYERDNQRSFA
jgi:TP901 family phage tail tape measure protein